jgi:hypothetical protein
MTSPCHAEGDDLGDALSASNPDFFEGDRQPGENGCREI